MLCSTILFAAATQVIAIHYEHTELMHISAYRQEQHRQAFVLYCDGWPLPVDIGGGQVTFYQPRKDK